MALAFTTRGTGGDNSTGTSTTISPTANLTPATLGVLCIALDNAGSLGSTAAAPAGPISDSAGNVWTRRIDGIYDNGAASNGVEVAIYTSNLGGIGFRTTDTLVLSWIAGVSVVAKAWTIQECSAAAGKRAIFGTGAAGTGATTGAPTVTTSSIASGDAVVGVGGVESADTWAGDADSTNGSWAAQQHTGFGSGTSGMSVTSQTKVTTGTATQTYNPTCTSADTMLAWISLTEAINPFFQSHDASAPRNAGNETLVSRQSYYFENLLLTTLAPRIPIGLASQIRLPQVRLPIARLTDTPNLLMGTLAPITYQMRAPILQKRFIEARFQIQEPPNLIMTTLVIPTTDAVGSASATSTTAAVGAALFASPGEASSIAAATAVGASLSESVGTAAEVSTASGVGISAAASPGSASSTSDAPGLSNAIIDFVGSISALAACVAIGAALSAAVGSSSSTSTALAVPAGAYAGSASSTSDAPGVGASLVEASGSSSEISTALGVGASLASADGAAAMISTALALGNGLLSAVGSASELSDAIAIAQSTAQSAGTSASAFTATAVGVGIIYGTGSSDSISTSLALATAIKFAAGSAQGSSDALADAVSTAEAVGEASATVLAEGIGLSELLSGEDIHDVAARLVIYLQPDRTVRSSNDGSVRRSVVYLRDESSTRLQEVQ